MMEIASRAIHGRLGSIDGFKDADSIAFYYSTGSEVMTEGMILESLSKGRRVSLPKVTDTGIIFMEIDGLGSVERGSFGIMEPKDRCPVRTEFDVAVVPAVGVTRSGSRLGYGQGYYDKFLAGRATLSIALVYAKQVVRSIPTDRFDVPVDWVVTERESINVKRS